MKCGVIKDLTLLLEDKQSLKRMPNEGTVDVPLV